MSFYGNIFTNMGYTLQIEQINGEEGTLIYEIELKSESGDTVSESKLILPFDSLMEECQVNTTNNTLDFYFRTLNNGNVNIVSIPLTDLVPNGSIGTTKLANGSVTLDKINYTVEDGFLVIQ